MAISDTIKKGMIRAPHRSLLRATGVIQSEEDFYKPFIAVCNSFVQIIPGHAHLDVVGEKSARGRVRRRGHSVRIQYDRRGRRHRHGACGDEVFASPAGS